jgi:hypothetical protein
MTVLCQDGGHFVLRIRSISQSPPRRKDIGFHCKFKALIERDRVKLLLNKFRTLYVIGNLGRYLCITIYAQEYYLPVCLT